MPNYLTPKRYRSLGTGASLTGKTDSELSAHIAGASALVNAYCAAPAGHDFRGGSITDEAHAWDPGTVKTVGSFRVWPYHRPIKTVVSMEIEVTNNQRISFVNPDSLYVEPSMGYVEPVDLALTSFGVFGYGVLPNIGLKTPVAKLAYTYGWSFEAEEHIATASGTSELQAENQFWTDDDVVVVKNGLTLSSGYTLDRYEGTVALDTPADEGDEFVVSYVHTLPTAIAHATGILVTEMLGASSIAKAGLYGLSGIRVKEVELRQSKASFLGTGMSPLASAFLDPYVYRSWG
jgi:hypothetical protein